MAFNTRQLKQMNLDRIRSVLKAEDFSTKSSLAAISGLSVATCGNILEELLQSGEVREIELASSTGGRPSRRFVYNENFAFVLLMYLRKEGDLQTIYSSLVNMRGEQIYESFEDYETLTIEEIDRTLRVLIEKYPKIQVISMGLPGIIDKGVIGSCDIESLGNFAIVNYLEKKYDRIVTVSNDVNTTALGYYQRMEKIHPESLVYIYYPENGLSGAGIIVNGKVVQGRTNFAGELSYMPVRIEREEQGRIQKNINIFSKLVSELVLSINCILNPDCIVLSGKSFNEEIKEIILDLTLKSSLPGHSPGICFEPDIHFSYLDGLKYSGLHKLSCGLEIVEK